MLTIVVFFANMRSIATTGNTSTLVIVGEQSPPKTSPVTTDDLSQRDQETGPKVCEDMPTDQLMEELNMASAHQAMLVAQLKARYAGESSWSVQKDKEIALLKAQLVDARIEAEAAKSYAHKVAEEKMSLLSKVDQERADSSQYKANCLWGLKYLEGVKDKHFAALNEFCQKVEELLEK